MKNEKKWRRLPASFDLEVLKDIQKLAAKGANKTEIIRTLQLTANSLHRYKETTAAYEAGRDDLRRKIRKTMIDSCDTSPTSQRVLADRLGLFSDEIQLDFEIDDIQFSRYARIENYTDRTYIYFDAKGIRLSHS